MDFPFFWFAVGSTVMPEMKNEMFRHYPLRASKEKKYLLFRNIFDI
jgi:hypothetical protein